ncbi:MAG: hypothetical protein LBI39_03970 [Puniceicoccales bacterium]|jgi:multiple antibiotic resistance protein|nr:hypothetical protein [Puniceicoccales bacterium]
MVGPCPGEFSHFNLFAGGVLALLRAINPLAVGALFLASFSGYGFRQRKFMVRASCLIAFFIILSFSYWGIAILNTLGVGVPSIHVACGIVFAYVGFKFLCAEDVDESDGDGQSGPPRFSKARPDMSVIPLALPMVAGAEPLAVAMSYGQNACGPLGKLTVAASVGFAVAAVFAVLTIANVLCAFLSDTFKKLFFRIGGLIILAIAFQQILVGLEHMEPFCRMVGR